MSVHKIMTHQVVCDSCGVEHGTVADSALGARIKAGQDGWRFGQSSKRKGNVNGQRDFDWCAKCPDPRPEARGETRA